MLTRCAWSGAPARGLQQCTRLTSASPASVPPLPLAFAYTRRCSCMPSFAFDCPSFHELVQHAANSGVGGGACSSFSLAFALAALFSTPQRTRILRLQQEERNVSLMHIR